MRLFVNFCNLEGDSAQYLLGCYPTSVWTSLPNNISYFIDIKSVNKITKFKEKNNNKRTFFQKVHKVHYKTSSDKTTTATIFHLSKL